MKKMKMEFNQHLRDFRCVFTIEFCVKNPPTSKLTETVFDYEWATGAFTNRYAEECYAEILKAVGERQTWQIVDWSFAGRMQGWFALLCMGKEQMVTKRSLDVIEEIVRRYFLNYGYRLQEYYQEQLN